VVSMHAGHAALSHIGQGTETIVAAGKVLEIAQELREMAARIGKTFAISSDVFSAAQVTPPTGDAVVINSLGKEPALSAYLTDSASRNPAGDTQRKKQWREKLGQASDLIKTIVQA
jgi:hypothetical protein